MSARSALHSSKSNEWYTPPGIMVRARGVLGRIDLDPASCDDANAIVCAHRFYTKADDGLNKPWNAQALWLNPPYGRQAGAWVAKLIAEVKCGNVRSALLLVNATTDRKWFRPLWEHHLCFPYTRIQFVDRAGTPGPNPTHGSCIVSLSHTRGVRQITAFRREFGSIGHIVAPNRS